MAHYGLFCSRLLIFWMWLFHLSLNQAQGTELVLEVGSEDPLLEVHEDVPDETRLPNAHSAAVVMGCIFLCVIAYCLYRFFKYKCELQSRPLVVSSETQKAASEDQGFKGLEDYIKEREAYLAIYGTKRNSVSAVTMTKIT